MRGLLCFRLRRFCQHLCSRKWFDYGVLFFIALNCITLAMERPDIPKYSTERQFLTIANYIFTFIFTMEMTVKVGGESFTSAPAFVHICPRPIYINFRLKSQSQFTSAPDSHPRVSSHQSQLVSFFCLTPVHINSRFK